MEQELKKYALTLWGEYVRQKRQTMNLLQSELGSRLHFGSNTAKQSVSQLENGRSWIPQNKFAVFIKELKLDESIFRQLNYYYNANDYRKMSDMLRNLLYEEFNIQAPAWEQVSTPSQANPPPSSAVPIDPNQLTERLAKLKEAFDHQLLTEREYEEARKRVLEQYLEGK